MTTKQLEKKIRILGDWGYGCKKIEINYHGKLYTFKTSNLLATDRIKMDNWFPMLNKFHNYTYKEALQALYDEFVRDYYWKVTMKDTAI